MKTLLNPRGYTLEYLEQVENPDGHHSFVHNLLTLEKEVRMNRIIKKYLETNAPDINTMTVITHNQKIDKAMRMILDMYLLMRQLTLGAAKMTLGETAARWSPDGAAYLTLLNDISAFRGKQCVMFLDKFVDAITNHLYSDDYFNGLDRWDDANNLIAHLEIMHMDGTDPIGNNIGQRIALVKQALTQHEPKKELNFDEPTAGLTDSQLRSIKIHAQPATDWRWTASVITPKTFDLNEATELFLSVGKSTVRTLVDVGSSAPVDYLRVFDTCEQAEHFAKGLMKHGWMVGEYINGPDNSVGEDYCPVYSVHVEHGKSIISDGKTKPWVTVAVINHSCGQIRDVKDWHDTQADAEKFAQAMMKDGYGYQHIPVEGVNVHQTQDTFEVTGKIEVYFDYSDNDWHKVKTFISGGEDKVFTDLFRNDDAAMQYVEHVLENGYSDTKEDDVDTFYPKHTVQKIELHTPGDEADLYTDCPCCNGESGVPDIIFDIEVRDENFNSCIIVKKKV